MCRSILADVEQESANITGINFKHTSCTLLPVTHPPFAEQVAEAVQAGATSILADVEQEAEVEALLDAMVKQQRGEGEAADEDEEFEGEEGADEYEARPRQRASKADAKEGEGEGAAAGKGGEEASSSGREVEQVRQALRQVPFMKLIHGVPVFFVEDVDDMASKLACALYGG